MEDEEAGKAAEAAAGGWEGGEKRGHKVGGLSRTVRARGWGLTTTTPQRRGFLFVPREFLFVSFPVARPHPPIHPPQPHPIPPSESFDSSARLCHPPSRFIRPLILRSLPPSTASSLHLTSYHRPPKIRVRYYLSPDRSRSTTPANVLFRSLPRRILLPLVRGHPTITGPRTI